MHFTVALFLALGVTGALHIWRNISSTLLVQYIDNNLTIDPGVYFSVSKNWKLDVETGDVLVDGAWHNVADDTRATILKIQVDLFVVNGIFQFNNLLGNIASNFLAFSDKFENNGDMYFGIAPQQHEPAVSIISRAPFLNTGMMVFRGDGDAREIQLDCDGREKTIVNQGSICLFNATFLPKNNLEGKGCIYLGNGTTLTVRHDKVSFDALQVIVMDSNTEVFFLGFGESRRITNDRFTISGFGQGKFILVDFFVDSFAYSLRKGEVTLFYDLSLSITFVIGQGYHFGDFTMSEGRNRLGYAGIQPNRAYACRCVKEFPGVFDIPARST